MAESAVKYFVQLQLKNVLWYKCVTQISNGLKKSGFPGDWWGMKKHLMTKFENSQNKNCLFCMIEWISTEYDTWEQRQLYILVYVPFNTDKVGKSLVFISKSCRATIVQLATGSGYESGRGRRPTRTPPSFRLWHKHNESQCQRSRRPLQHKGTRTRCVISLFLQ